MFRIMLISVITLMHIYVFRCASSVPFITKHIPRLILIGTGIFLWALFLSARLIGHNNKGVFAYILEFAGMNWMAVLFLLFVSLLAVDIITLFGAFFPRIATLLRGWALLAGIVLSAFALYQGLRAPVIEKYEVTLPGLPHDMDKTVIAGLSDTHLGSLLGNKWLNDRIDQVENLKPDLVVLLGDTFEGHGKIDDDLIEPFKRLSAPLGVFAVPGNHEFYGNVGKQLLENARVNLLRNRWEEVKPGFIVAGVDDLTIISRKGYNIDPVHQALKDRPKGATILLSHTPWDTDKAAEAGVGLMLCGHTHGGQIWPFGYLVRLFYPLMEGQYTVDGMAVIVCRGTGTWGPRMRLFRPGEILQITLRSK
ncbi:MAG: metallophosphoesterase [Proteobacteria bacterium]|nr:metallophosphoesterase [Pseudomonadota bacterium]